MNIDPKIKAKELIDLFEDLVPRDNCDRPPFSAKKSCALIVVNEFIKQFESREMNYYLSVPAASNLIGKWEEVRTEIENIKS